MRIEMADEESRKAVSAAREVLHVQVARLAVQNRRAAWPEEARRDAALRALAASWALQAAAVAESILDGEVDGLDEWIESAQDDSGKIRVFLARMGARPDMPDDDDFDGGVA